MRWQCGCLPPNEKLGEITGRDGLRFAQVSRLAYRSGTRAVDMVCSFARFSRASAAS
jgi:hypothetical protein